jgi:putative addiction module killer protein
VNELRFTPEFDKWLAGLRDREARSRVIIRLHRLRIGNPGEMRALAEGVAEMKIDYGPGYRVYYTQRGSVLIVVLGGGTKKTQDRDIQAALALARTL